MTTAPGKDPGRMVVVCVDDDPAVRQSLVHDLEAIWGERVTVEGCASGAEALALADGYATEQTRVALVLADQVMPEMNGVELLVRLQEHEWLRSAKKVLVSSKASLDDVTRALNCGALNARVSKPWSTRELEKAVRHLVTEFAISEAPEALEELGELADAEQLSQAYVLAEERRRQLDQQVASMKRSFLSDFNVPDEQVEQAMLQSIQAALPEHGRDALDAGTVLFREGEAINGIWVLLSGQARLSRTVDGQETIFHAQTTGRIIGLLSLSLGGTSFFDCVATTPVEAIHLTLDELDSALQNDPALSVHFVAALLRSLARRNRRAVELQVELDHTRRVMAKERDQLALTVEQLKRAQTLLVEKEKMATLGQLAAGVAHELNNPVAAIQRSAEFLMEDLQRLAPGHEDGEALLAMLDRALTRPPLSTREQRALRATLAEQTGNAELARHLVELGFDRPDEFESYFGSLAPGQQLARAQELKHHAQLGKSLRNIRSCAERITSLVKSLRSYARAEQHEAAQVLVREGLEDSLMLFGHELKDIQVTRNYGEVPPVSCIAGELNQVWTNLISNAIQAMHGKGALRVETDQPDPDHVRVRLTDSGSGIPPGNLDRIFDVNFTTRQGRVDFGLGIGLAICKDIVTRHGGEIRVVSQPGETCFTITLPAGRAEPVPAHDRHTEEKV